MTPVVACATAAAAKGGTLDGRLFLQDAFEHFDLFRKGNVVAD